MLRSRSAICFRRFSETAVAAASEDSAVFRLPRNVSSSACEGGRNLRNINRMPMAVPIRAPLIAQRNVTINSKGPSLTTGSGAPVSP